MNKKILVADDETLIREFMASFFQSAPEYSGCKVDFAVNGEEAIAKIKQTAYDLVITDLKMPYKNGIEVIKFTTENSPNTDTVLITAFGEGESATLAMAYGAYEYITKPISIEELEFLLKHIFERQELIKVNEELKQQLHHNVTYPKVIGKSKKMSDIMDIVKLVAPTNTTVLITGESGTGKELIAEAIHQLSPRSRGNFIKINCAAIPESLIESELFGFEKGAFTGAIKHTRGKFEMADKGSILLDEISEMNLDLQSKLLRVIQEKEIYRIGSEMPQKIDVRIIATSNRDLSEEIKKGTFREDLFFRLNIIPIHLPPVRDRKEDIPHLVDSFIKKSCFELGVEKKRIPGNVMDLMIDYDWPGNIREIQNAVERACITNPDAILKRETLSFIESKLSSPPKPVHTEEENVKTDYYDQFEDKPLAEVEKEMIFRTLTKTNNNKTEAAKILGVTARTLRNKLDLYEKE